MVIVMEMMLEVLIGVLVMEVDNVADEVTNMEIDKVTNMMAIRHLPLAKKPNEEVKIVKELKTVKEVKIVKEVTTVKEVKIVNEENTVKEVKKVRK